MHEKRKSMRTLDDLPAEITSGQIRADNVSAGTMRAWDSQRPTGYWEIQSARTPGAWRRFWTWALLGWRWKPIK